MKTKLVPVEPTVEMLSAADAMTDLILPSAVDPSTEGRRKELRLAYKLMLEAAPIPANLPDREEVAMAIFEVVRKELWAFYGPLDEQSGWVQHRASLLADAAISTLLRLGWRKV